jgi:hypothetical protein
MTISIKMEPEIRHVLAHMIYAIEALANGNQGEAQYEIEQIKGLLFWDSDAASAGDMEKWHRQENDDGEVYEKGEEDKERLQGQEIRQGQEKELPP